MSKECLIKQIRSLINKIYNDQHRPFYSEMDFQYNLLLMLENNKPEGWSIYTEVPYINKDNEYKRIDICVVKHSIDDIPEKNEIYLIELKYKTGKGKETYNSPFEPFLPKPATLKDFSCYTNNRRDFFKDIEDLENLLNDKSKKVKSAFAIFLTNCENYAKNERKKNFLMGKDKNNDNDKTCSLKKKKNGKIEAKGEWCEVKYVPFSESQNDTVHFNIVEIPKETKFWQ